MKYLIIGGTGTLGHELAKRLIRQDVTIFSRCELKQQEMKLKFPGFKYVVGDIRNLETLDRLFRGHFDTVFHVAALKHVDVLESNPEEAVQTNIIGTTNIADMCERYGVRNCVFSSTDKAVEPINSYGASKFLAEKILLNRNRGFCRFVVYRWGNILGSRGSAIPRFVQSLKTDGSVSITDMAMTRFWLTIEQAVTFMFDTYRTCDESVPQIPNCKAASIPEVVDALSKILNLEMAHFKLVGLRPGEKIHETLKPGLVSKTAPQFTRDELIEFLKPMVSA